MSGLFGTKRRLPKDDPVYEALGSVDELNSLIGFTRAYAKEYGAADETDEGIHIQTELKHVQETLFIVQAELAGAEKRVTQAHVDALEEVIGHIESAIEKPKSFVVPGATGLSGLLDYTRAVVRRTERTTLKVRMSRNGSHTLSMETRAYLNRLSSFFYALARYTAQKSGVAETPPMYELTRNKK